MVMSGEHNDFSSIKLKFFSLFQNVFNACICIFAHYKPSKNLFCLLTLLIDFDPKNTLKLSTIKFQK